ncbi:MAG TPA: hypothetical protein VLV56_17820 [Burkholderiales bacterium]|nr:hypothetical protein [Burkholderiales bacterium]
MMHVARRPLILGAAFALLFTADVTPEAPFGVTLVPDARAIIGMPLTPMSYAGVARRTTRRVVYTEATVATAATASAAAAGAAAASPAAAQPKPPPPPAAGPVPVGTVVMALPPGCVATPIGGVEYYNCAPGVYYRAAFQGNNLVYVAAQP